MPPSNWPLPASTEGPTSAAAAYDAVPDYAPLFAAVREALPLALQEHWYICALTARPNTQLAALTTGRYASTAAKSLFPAVLPPNATREQTQTQHRHFRELLFQLTPIVGAPKVLEGIMNLTASLAPEQLDASFSRRGWTPQATAERGRAWLQNLYRGDLGQIDTVLGRDADFLFLSTDLTYGLFLSDRSEISGLESEVLVTSSMIAQGMPREASWHMRALRYLGVSMDDVRGLRAAVEKVLVFMGQGEQIRFVPTVEEVETTMQI